MSRLLFAASRGARLEYFDTFTKKWFLCRSIPVERRVYDAYYRIHPDDAHLAYGPISTAVRKMVETGAPQQADLPYLVGYWELSLAEGIAFDKSRKHRDMFMLLVAEALAEEGL